MTRSMKSWWALMTVALLLAPAGWAQRTNPIGPNPPIGEDEESSSKRMEEPEPEPAEPDDGPLGGAESSSLGGLGGLLEGRKYYRYSLNFSQRVGFGTGTGSMNLTGSSNLNGVFELRRALPRSELSVMYRAGAFLNDELGSTESFHSLNVRQSWQKGRWNFLLGEQLFYAPESPYTLVMGGQLLSMEFNINGQAQTNSIFLPGQHILSGRTARLGNTAFGQAQYRLGPRTSLFAAGGYGFLKFIGSGLSDFSQPSLVLGLNRNLTSSDSIGVNYNFGQFRFSKGDSNISTHSVHLAYGRRLSGRMALEISGGPQISNFRDPLLGPLQRVNWTAGGGLQYNLGRSQLGLSYHHALNGGSGVLEGAEGDSIYLSWHRPLRRTWNMNVILGYSRNTAVRASSTSAVRPEFETTYASLHLSRSVGSDKRVYMSYNASHQLSSGGTGFPMRHGLEIGLSWNPRAHRID